jgi:PhnB protein
MQLSPYLHFNGNCAEAFAFYAKCLSGTIVFQQTFGESPAKDQAPPGWNDKIVHVALWVGNWMLLGSDAPPPHYSKPQGMTVSVSVDSYPEAERLFNTLAEKGTITMPFQKTFWSDGFGMAVDRFAIPWMVNYQSPQQS